MTTKKLNEGTVLYENWKQRPQTDTALTAQLMVWLWDHCDGIIGELNKAHAKLVSPGNGPNLSGAPLEDDDGGMADPDDDE